MSDYKIYLAPGLALLGLLLWFFVIEPRINPEADTPATTPSETKNSPEKAPNSPGDAPPPG